tara:strand:- start:646 stop:1620 length:975 start_codon:yes stop_codon:yes gene_type:complete
MHKIVCLGTSHTFGGGNGIPYSFDEGWPGHLSKYLERHNIDNFVYNGGESSFSSFFYPTKILNFYNEYKPDMFVIEIPDTDKVDLEISSHITGTYINKQKDYHPIYSRQRVLTKNWERGEQYGWPNRKSISKQECVDFYHGADTTASVRDFFKGKTTWTIEGFYRNASLSDHERDNVKQKFNELYKALGKNDEQFKNMLIYCYFYSVFMDMSDTDISNYLSNMMNIINTLKSLNVKFLLFTHCDKQYDENHVYKDTYKSVLDKPDYWLNEKMDWSFINWAKQMAGNKTTFDNMHSDKIHFKPQVYSMFTKELLGPQVVKKLKER